MEKKVLQMSQEMKNNPLVKAVEIYGALDEALMEMLEELESIDGYCEAHDELLKLTEEAHVEVHGEAYGSGCEMSPEERRSTLDALWRKYVKEQQSRMDAPRRRLGRERRADTRRSNQVHQ